MTERDAYIGFASFLGIGPMRFKLLTEFFGSAQKAWEASGKDILATGLGEKLGNKFINYRTTFKPEEYEQKLLQQEIKIVTRIDKNFPKLLSQISDCPIALFVKGNLPLKWDRAIGIVGTRKPTYYGQNITQKIAGELAEQNLIIVSGMARGVDSIAHREALKNQAVTVAVLGCGVDVIYPPENKDLYGQIIQTGGSVISEVPPGHTVMRGLFPARNRIISGLCKGILVTEGATDSGSLITAGYAAEQGREVFAVPGPITSYLSAGPTKLLKNGAKMVTEVNDILDELRLEKKAVTLNNHLLNYPTASTLEKSIIDLLAKSELHFDEIVRSLNMAPANIAASISVLELNGIIQPLGNGKYGLK